MAETVSVTVITANYYPEDTAIGLYTTQFTQYLAEKGYNVNVITGFPYYPQWSVFKDYIDKPSQMEEYLGKIRILRYRQYVPGKVTFAGRIKMMLSFLYGAMKNVPKVQNSDIVICIVPFTISILPAIRLKKRHNAKLWIHIQDFEFDLAFQSGILKDNIFITPLKNLIYRFEKKWLLKADVLSSISFSMLKKITEKTQNTNPYLMPNWVSAEKINPEKAKNHPYINQNSFTMLYSGNVGEKQDWNTLVNLCSMMQAKNEAGIDIVIVGDGGYMPTLKKLLAGYSFVTFYPPVAYEELSDLLCSASLHFLFQKTDVLDSIMPSKLLGMMASAKPSIITGNENSEVAEIINQSKGGYYFCQAESNQLYDTVLKFKNDKDFTEKTGNNAREFIIGRFSENTILNGLDEKIKAILA